MHKGPIDVVYNFRSKQSQKKSGFHILEEKKAYRMYKVIGLRRERKKCKEIQTVSEIGTSLDFRQIGPVQFPDILLVQIVRKRDASLDHFR